MHYSRHALCWIVLLCVSTITIGTAGAVGGMFESAGLLGPPQNPDNVDPRAGWRHTRHPGRSLEPAAELLVDLLNIDEYMDRQATLALYRKQPGYPVDLNGDGQDEYICEPTWYIDRKGCKSSMRGATGNGQAWVLAKRDGQWVEIGDVSGKATYLRSTSTNGWRDIENYVDSGVVNYQFLFKYHNGRYHGRQIGENRQTSH